MRGPRTVSQVAGLPELGQGIVVRGITKQRALVGWNHQEDTIAGRKIGKIWCWVGGDCFQVYDQEYNRSAIAGDYRDCGVANFTMIRMFHPYWCPMGLIPHDKVSDDKRACRQLYRQLIRRLRIDQNLPVDDDPDDPFQPPADQDQDDGRRTRREEAIEAAVALVNERLCGESEVESDCENESEGEGMFYGHDGLENEPEIDDDTHSVRSDSLERFLSPPYQPFTYQNHYEQTFYPIDLSDDEEDWNESEDDEKKPDISTGSDQLNARIEVDLTRDSDEDVKPPPVVPNVNLVTPEPGDISQSLPEIVTLLD